MAIELPAAQKVYTTKYDNFKGVDFTNDSTNIWRRRSPTGVNMLPDASGRPFKRKGWDILITNKELCDYFELDSCSINKCAYFELAGVDHIVIFTDAGVVFYNGSLLPTTKESFQTEVECYSGYDRCFFFEGDGTSAFYIYGDFRVWKYCYENDSFVFREVTDEITVPTVMIGASADLAGTIYEGYNLLGTKASIEYNSTELFTYWCSDGISITVDDSFKTGKTIGSPAIYRWKWTGSAWSDVNSTGVSFPPTGVTLYGTQKENDEVFIVYDHAVMLPNNVPDTTGVKVWASTSRQFDTPLEVVSGTPSSGQAQVVPNGTLNLSDDKKRAWIKFNATDNWSEIVSGEDFIKVEFPSVNVSSTLIQSGEITETANLVVGV